MGGLPIFLQDPKVYEIFKDISKCLPKETKFYIVGGAMRNVMFYNYFKKKLPQRDYDSLIIGNHKKFIEDLRKKGFVYGKIRRKTQIVLKKKKIPNPKNIRDFVVLDIHWQKKGKILYELKKHASFTINGFAIEVRNLFSKNWRKRIIVIPNSINDLKAKKLKVVNAIDNKYNLFAAIRFMSLGFKKPNKNDIARLFQEFKNAPQRRRKRNLKKLFDYVGGKKEAEKLANRMGLDLNELINLK